MDSVTTVFGDGFGVVEQKAQIEEQNVQIVDDRFKIDGVWYSIVEDGANGKRLEYSETDDRDLVQIPITDDGYGVLQRLGLQFQIDVSDGTPWNKIIVIRKHQSGIIDKLNWEECEFDGFDVDIYPS